MATMMIIMMAIMIMMIIVHHDHSGRRGVGTAWTKIFKALYDEESKYSLQISNQMGDLVTI
jgi:hypothetical protein